MKLHSARLLKIAECIARYKKGTILADIGTDHAYLPCFLYSQNIIDLAYACDIAKGPLESSQATIDSEHLNGHVIPLLGDGLDPIANKNTDMIAICGMGGLLMSQILDAHRELLKNHRFFLQANTAIDLLREYLVRHDMAIIDEFMVKDGHHIYEIIVSEYGSHVSYSQEDLIFGPCLRVKRGDLFMAKWQHERDVQKRILAQLDVHHERYATILAYHNMIERELNNAGKTNN